MNVRDLGRLAGERLVAAVANLRQRVAETTPGQYWTSGLALLVAIPILLFGMPPKTAVVEASAEPPAPSAPPPALPPTDPGTDAEILSGPAPPARGAAPRPTLPSAPAPGPVLGGGSGNGANPGSQPVTLPGIVLLSQSGTGPPGHSDRDIAEALAASSPYSFQLLEADLGDDVACQQAGAPETLVVTSFGMSATLRDCLLAAGASVLGYDDNGSIIRGQGPVALSTAHGAGRALLDLAAWAVPERASGETVGLVASEGLRDTLEPVLPAAAAAGFPVAETAWLAADLADDAAVTDAVLAFSVAGVDTLVFAAPAELQRRWLARSSLLLAGARHLVLGVADSIVDESYPPSFDGAAAVTVVNFPWIGRTPQGLSDEQAACQATWEAAAGVVLSDAELGRAMAWCQHLDITEQVIAGVAAGETLREALLAVATDALVTSPVAWHEQGWGPTATHLLRWTATCGCWEPAES